MNLQAYQIYRESYRLNIFRPTQWRASQQGHNLLDAGFHDLKPSGWQVGFLFPIFGE